MLRAKVWDSRSPSPSGEQLRPLPALSERQALLCRLFAGLRLGWPKGLAGPGHTAGTLALWEPAAPAEMR